MDLPMNLLLKINDKCVVSKNALLEYIKNSNLEIDETITLLLAAAHVTIADGKVRKKERKLLEDFLETFDQKRDATALINISSLTSFSSRSSGDVMMQIAEAYSFTEGKSLSYRKLRSEIPINLRGIKTAELAYESNFDVYVSADPYPPISSGDEAKQWVRNSAGGFSTIGWSPDGDVRGTYWVTTTDMNFTAWGIIDLDGDGKYATYMATKSENPNSPITGPDVF